MDSGLKGVHRQTSSGSFCLVCCLLVVAKAFKRVTKQQALKNTFYCKVLVQNQNILFPSLYFFVAYTLLHFTPRKQMNDLNWVHYVHWENLQQAHWFHNICRYRGFLVCFDGQQKLPIYLANPTKERQAILSMKIHCKYIFVQNYRGQGEYRCNSNYW